MVTAQRARLKRSLEMSNEPPKVSYSAMVVALIAAIAGLSGESRGVASDRCAGERQSAWSATLPSAGSAEVPVGIGGVTSWLAVVLTVCCWITT
jgi:hypothetical protein